MVTGMRIFFSRFLLTNPTLRMVVTFERFKGENTFPGRNI